MGPMERTGPQFRPRVIPSVRHVRSRTASTRRRMLGLVGGLGLSAALALSACTAPARSLSVASPGQAQAAQALPSPAPFTPSGDPVVDVVAKVAPAVVNITSETQSPDSIFGGGGGKGVGTGFVIRSDGVIVTNFHVVEGAVKLTVTLPEPNGRVLQGRVIGGDSEHDVAVVKVDATGLPTVALGDSSQVALGERVIALGYALALPGGPTVTTGIISSTARTVQVQDPNGPDGPITRTLQDVFQTDAAINPGNSGGPLVDMAGNVVGINTAGSGNAENIGFAIDVNAVKPIIDRAISSPAAPTAYLGVSTTTVDAGVAAQFGLGVDHGALVVDVTPDGPAAKAGISAGDVIVSFDGNEITDAQQLGDLILDHQPNDKVQVGLSTEGGDQTVSATLGVRPLPAETP
jgi:serine protease Do